MNINTVNTGRIKGKKREKREKEKKRGKREKKKKIMGKIKALWKKSREIERPDILRKRLL